MIPRYRSQGNGSRIIIMTPDRHYASRFLAESRNFERHVEVNACISVAATLMLSSHYAPDLILLDACYGEAQLKQVVRAINYEVPHATVLLLCEEGGDATRRIVQEIAANGWAGKDLKHSREVFNLLCSVALPQRESGMRHRIKWSSSQIEMGFTLS